MTSSDRGLITLKAAPPTGYDGPIRDADGQDEPDPAPSSLPDGGYWIES